MSPRSREIWCKVFLSASQGVCMCVFVHLSFLEDSLEFMFNTHRKLNLSPHAGASMFFWVGQWNALNSLVIMKIWEWGERRDVTKIEVVTQLLENKPESSLTQLTLLLDATKCSLHSSCSTEHSLFSPVGPHTYQSTHFLTAHIGKRSGKC